VPRALPLVSYVLVNWKTEATLPRALESIARQSHPQREVILVNNGSPGWDPGLIAGQELKLLDLPRNLGFAAGNNAGIRASLGDYVVLLNCDAWLAPDFTARALAVFEANPRIGSVVPKLLAGDASGRLDSCGHVMYTDRTCSNRGHGELDQGQYERGEFVFGGTAAAIAYRREMLETVSSSGWVFDPAFFAYFEDVDLDWRAQLCGWLAYYEPGCQAWHMAHGSGGRGSYRVRFLAEKNRYLMLARNDSLSSALAQLPAILLYESYHLLQTLLRPWLWPAYLLLLWHLPGAWLSRLVAGRQRVIPPGQVAQMFEPRGLHLPPHPALPAVGKGLAESRDSGNQLQASTYPLVSVVLVNFDGLNLTRACLTALMAQSYSPLEIIVVDNGSAVNEAELLALDYAAPAGTVALHEQPLLRTLRLERNLGFSGGVNWGVSQARGEYIVLINNDCIPDSDCIRQLVYAARREQAAAVSGRLVNVKDSGAVAAVLKALDAEQEAAEDIVWELPPGIEAALAESRRNHGMSLYGYFLEDVYATGQCFYPSGGLCCLERRAVEALLPQLVPQGYFAYHEDVALGLALHLQGAKIVKEPRASAAHLASSTARRLGSLRLRYLQERNRWLNLLCFYPAAVLLGLKPLLLLQSLGVFCGALLTRPLDALGILGAHLWLLLHPGLILAQRRHWRSRRRAGQADSVWLRELSARVRGPAWASRLSIGWCRLLRIPCRENS